MKSNLSARRLERLNSIDFVWDTLSEAWEEAFTKLQKFQEREGHCKVTHGHKEDGFAVASWIRTQRKTKDKISPDRIERLNSIDFIWDPFSEAWEEAFTKLLQFCEREGHCRVPSGYKEDGFTLGSWVGVQRRTRKEDSLPEGRIERLDAMDFVWSIKSGV